MILLDFSLSKLTCTSLFFSKIEHINLLCWGYYDTGWVALHLSRSRPALVCSVHDVSLCSDSMNASGSLCACHPVCRSVSLHQARASFRYSFVATAFDQVRLDSAASGLRLAVHSLLRVGDEVAAGIVVTPASRNPCPKSTRHQRVQVWVVQTGSTKEIIGAGDWQHGCKPFATGTVPRQVQVQKCTLNALNILHSATNRQCHCHEHFPADISANHPLRPVLQLVGIPPCGWYAKSCTVHIGCTTGQVAQCNYQLLVT